eukprot:GEMP01014651.1.p1 GENE.GEMP01014651.1~~GEMP01014651.1.p1  ORF type:complete len:250 (+),score=87.89 GEMP01014651.1:102-851(+)
MRLFFGNKKQQDSSNAPSGGGGAGASQHRAEQLKGAIDKNNQAIDNLDKRQRLLEKRVTDMDTKARDAARAKNKRGAMEALKRKKMVMSELETLTNAKMTLEQQVMTMEAAQTQAAAVQALAGGVKAQKNLQQELNIDQVDSVMEEMQEQQDIQNEIAQCFQQGTTMMDDDDLLEEFNNLQAEELEKDLLDTERQMLDIGATPSTAVPQAAPPAPAQKVPQMAGPMGGGDLTDNEAAELAALQARLDLA